MVQIRPFDWRRHGRAVVEFQREIYETNFPGFVADDQFLRDYGEQLRRSYRNDATEGIYVLEDGRRTLGFLWLSLIATMVDPCIGYIKNIYVAPDIRGQGYGKMLLGFAETWCLQRGVGRLSLDASCCNEAAVALYKHWGYHIARVRMEKEIRPRVGDTTGEWPAELEHSGPLED